ncbi:hypothetical protein [Pantoea sp. DY-5]|uniref:hypothetical protein n=1 Tax=Pantoea sp. DY-5 TaxID=2871488 RepID=UPI001C9746B1|nr:hypothetical protein [Pantoea sp. DY-5]MBY4839710.1 hypothetical protein [Pantoea sp. DY-5]
MRNVIAIPQQDRCVPQPDEVLSAMGISRHPTTVYQAVAVQQDQPLQAPEYNEPTHMILTW